MLSFDPKLEIKQGEADISITNVSNAGIFRHAQSLNQIFPQTVERDPNKLSSLTANKIPHLGANIGLSQLI